MELVRGLRSLCERHRRSWVTIGTFDGLHLGHRALIREVVARAEAASRPAMLLTFEPMPREVIRAQDPPARLTNFRERWRLLEPTGLASLLVLRFTEALRALPGESFARLLADDLQAQGIVVGYDFRFGRHGEANAWMLEAAGRRLGFGVHVMPPVVVDGQRVSSSAVREALAAGEFATAARWLGRAYTMRGRVIRGRQLGHTLGYPTANLRLRRCRSPLGGIFAVLAHGIGERPLPAVASLGTRPTVDGVEPLLETHVFDFSGELYGREIEIEFVQKLRDELRFQDLESLVQQMHRDAEQARSVLAAN
jgi:riboflavin kinase/FMN adenylyltransferase